MDSGLDEKNGFGTGALSSDGLDGRMLRWLDYEQTVNERLINEAVHVPIDDRSNTVRPHLRPERRPVWDLEVVWLPKDLVRCYGAVDANIRAAFGIDAPKDWTPLFLHPQPPGAHRRLCREYGSHRLRAIAATPTSSYRSVVAWSRSGDREPVLLKLSIGAIIGRVRRAFREDQIARGVVISSLFDTIPLADRRRLGLDWFTEPAGVAETRSGHGWLLRRLPRFLTEPGTTSVIPVFALISRRADRLPLLAMLIGRSKQTPEAFVVNRLIRPYVNAMAYLLFEQGLQYEGHTQNVLVKVGERDELTGGLVLRDLSDTTVNIAFRLAKGKAFPVFPSGCLPQAVPFPLAGNAADYLCNFHRSRIFRAFDTVERYGLWGFVWPINSSLARFFPGYDSNLVERRYLELWQQAAIDYLQLRPLFRKKPKGMATDEAIAYYLRQTDWRSLGATPAHLSDTAQALLIEGRMRRRGGPVYDRLECAWGDLFISNGLPGFFRPAF